MSWFNRSKNGLAPVHMIAISGKTISVLDHERERIEVLMSDMSIEVQTLDKMREVIEKVEVLMVDLNNKLEHGVPAAKSEVIFQQIIEIRRLAEKILLPLSGTLSRGIGKDHQLVSHLHALCINALSLTDALLSEEHDLKRRVDEYNSNKKNN